MTDPTSLSSLRRELAVLRRRYAVARDLGLPTADLASQIGVTLTKLEAAEHLMRQAEAGYRPVAV